LIEFALKEISFPVGCIQFLNIFPMTYAEFLLACGKDKLASLYAVQKKSIPRMCITGYWMNYEFTFLPAVCRNVSTPMPKEIN
jgi:hypothetical protein